MFNQLNEDDIFVIAEVGQNHQGDLNLALEYIRKFSELGADAVKFQMRDIEFLFDDDALSRPYFSENSFANTYGEHRKKLELSLDDFKKIHQECRRNNVKFMCTPFEENSLNNILELGVDIIKISSFDLGNLPFLEKIAKTNLPIVMSTGGGDDEQIDESISIIKNYNQDIAILHCVSEYPCEYNKLGLEKIKILKEKYSDLVIGSSDHFNGILSGPVAFLQGARVFEKHVTLNRSWKGTDHSFALEPDGFKKFVRDIQRTPKMLPQKDKSFLGKEDVFKKLGKSIIAKNNLLKGTVISTKDIDSKIFSEVYTHVRETKNIVGKKLTKNINKNDPIQYHHFN